jgi:glycosyltransferase involved in cell wall biosynthesis
MNEQIGLTGLRFGFVPYDASATDYCARMVAILERLGSVQPVPGPALRNILSGLFERRRLDAAFVSWYENRILDANGAVSVLRSCKVLLRTLALRVHAQKLIFIRHNHVPHATRPQDRALAKRLVDLYERWLFDGSLTHSLVEASPVRSYCPHPLYEIEPALLSPPPPLAAFSTETFYVVFGRIEPYKQLEQLIRAFPRDKRLVICGRCNDADYLAALTRSAPDNVTVLHGFLSEAEAQWLIRRSAGVLISHASEDMIVSASFFYAMSLAKRVYAVETPFLRWASSVLGDDIVVTAPELASLCERLAAVPQSAGSQRQLDAAIQQHFGDDTVARHLAAALERSDLHVRALPRDSLEVNLGVDSSSGEKLAAVCCSQRGDGALRS